MKWAGTYKMHRLLAYWNTEAFEYRTGTARVRLCGYTSPSVSSNRKHTTNSCVVVKAVAVSKDR